MAVRLLISFLLASWLISGGDVHAQSAIGVNLSGAEFGKIVPGAPGILGKNYGYPPLSSVQYFQKMGVHLMRLPFRWERAEKKLYGPLDRKEIAAMKVLTKEAYHLGMRIILDCHNYDRYYDNLIGSPEVPDEAFKYFWKLMAEEFMNDPGVYAYDIMNEPHDTDGHWAITAQYGVDGIRLRDRQKLILVPGDGYSSAAHWLFYNNSLEVHDPVNKVAYEAHQYFDADGSGRYINEPPSFFLKAVTLNTARLLPYLEWLRRKGFRGFMGELGVPGDDPRWLEVLDKALQMIKSYKIPATVWGGGRWFHYRLALEPKNPKNFKEINPVVGVMKENMK